jgi:hypothetical protein
VNINISALEAHYAQYLDILMGKIHRTSGESNLCPSLFQKNRKKSSLVPLLDLEVAKRLIQMGNYTRDSTIDYMAGARKQDN